MPKLKPGNYVWLAKIGTFTCKSCNRELDFLHSIDKTKILSKTCPSGISMYQLDGHPNSFCSAQLYPSPETAQTANAYLPTNRGPLCKHCSDYTSDKHTIDQIRTAGLAVHVMPEYLEDLMRHREGLKCTTKTTP